MLLVAGDGGGSRWQMLVLPGRWKYHYMVMVLDGRCWWGIKWQTVRAIDDGG